jgi:hypothetical protein
MSASNGAGLPWKAALTSTAHRRRLIARAVEAGGGERVRDIRGAGGEDARGESSEARREHESDRDTNEREETDGHQRPTRPDGVDHVAR